jgi:hypothetical protein
MIFSIIEINLEVYLNILRKYKNLIHIKKHDIAFNGLSKVGNDIIYSNNIDIVIKPIGIISI